VGGFRPGPVTLIHEWGVWSLVRRSFVGPGGAQFDRTFVRSPGAVAVVAVDGVGDDAKVLLVRQYRASFATDFWELPAGMRDVAGESLEETAHRELLEETGFTARHWSHLCSVAQAPGISNATVEIFYARSLVAGKARPQGPEEHSMSTQFVGLGEAVEMIRRSEIVNAVAVIGILRVVGEYA